MHSGSTASARRDGRTRAAVVGAAILMALSLTACAVSDEPVDRTPSSSPSSPPPPSASPGEPVLPPDGQDAPTALSMFAAVTGEVWASSERHRGRAYIDALVQAGFPKDRMQVTADRSTVDNPAESIQFSVAWNESECLVGQVGPSTGEPVTAILPRLADGACLVARTVPIDW